MEIKAKIHAVLPITSGSNAKGEWKKATVVLDITDGNYPKYLAVDNIKNADSFASLNVGDEGTFCVDVVSREYNGKWFTNATCWKWEIQTPVPENPVSSDAQAQQNAPTVQSEKPADDLPF